MIAAVNAAYTVVSILLEVTSFAKDNEYVKFQLLFARKLHM